MANRSNSERIVASNMSMGVLAMRLRLALLRQRVTADVERLMTDAEYASAVVALCGTLGGDCAGLAEQFMQEREALRSQASAAPAPPPAEAAAPAVQKASSRFAASRPAPAVKATTPAELGRTTTTSGASTVTGTTGSAAEHDRDDPDSPRNRRYLRGAR
jgi:hypothetical protein